jgi:hypothetical protein
VGAGDVGDGPWPESATELFERPQESFAEIAAELADCHDRFIGPHWERIRSVFDAEDGADRQIRLGPDMQVLQPSDAARGR